MSDSITTEITREDWQLWHGDANCPVPLEIEGYPYVDYKTESGGVYNGVLAAYVPWADVSAYRVRQEPKWICTICGSGKQALNGECHCAGSKKKYGSVPIADRSGVIAALRKGITADRNGVTAALRKGIDATLAKRGENYGTFYENAVTIQDIKRLLRRNIGWKNLAPDQKQSLEMIATKVGRILTGNPNVRDSWHDIEGYAKLVSDRLAQEEKANA